MPTTPNSESARDVLDEPMPERAEFDPAEFEKFRNEPARMALVDRILASLDDKS